MKHIKLFEYYKHLKDLLYHSTTITNIPSILKQDRLKVSRVWGGVSFNRENSFWFEGGANPIRFVLNKDILKHKYKIELYDDISEYDPEYQRPKSNIKRPFPAESEEKIFQDINNLHLYVEEIQINNDINEYNEELVETFFDELKTYTEEFPNIKINYYDIDSAMKTNRLVKFRNHYKIKQSNKNYNG